MILETIAVKAIGKRIAPTVDIIMMKNRSATHILAHIGKGRGGLGRRRDCDSTISVFGFVLMVCNALV